jgi:hypothetical protein
MSDESGKSAKKRILYIGAGVDVGVINIFPEKDVIFVDSMPFNENSERPYMSIFYRNWFIERLIEAYDDLGFDKIGEKELTGDFESWGGKEDRGDETEPAYFKPTMLLFKRRESDDDVVSRYYVSSAFPSRVSEELEADLKDADALFLSGYFPLTPIVDYLKKPFEVFCSDSSVYSIQKGYEIEDEGENIVHTLMNNKNFFRMAIKELSCFRRKEEIIVKCKDFYEVQAFSNDSAEYYFRQKELTDM